MLERFGKKDRNANNAWQTKNILSFNDMRHRPQGEFSFILNEITRYLRTFSCEAKTCLPFRIFFFLSPNQTQINN